LALGWSALAASRVAPGDYALSLITAGPNTVISSNSGWAKHFLQSYNEQTHSVTARLELPSLWYGLAYVPERQLLLASSGAGHVYVVSTANGELRLKKTISIPDCKVTAGLAALSASAAVVACDQTHEIVTFDILEGSVLARARTGEYPYAVRVIVGERIAVSLLGSSAVKIFNAKTLSVLGTIPVGRHPVDMLPLPGGTQLAVACSDSDSISIVDLRSLSESRRFDLSIPGKKLSGAQPDALAYDPETRRLWVALAGVSSLAVFDGVGEGFRFRGLIPVGPMPASLARSTTSGTLFIASARDPRPGANAKKQASEFDYVGSRLKGGVEALTQRDQARSVAGAVPPATQIYGPAPRPLSSDARLRIRQFTGPSGPIKHVFYVIKENRTYDQVFGDVPKGDGAPELTLFGEQVTPNHHQLARDFILFDRFFVDGYVSADGHLWSTAGTSTGYVDRFWPLTYSDRAAGPLDSPYDGDAEHDHPVAAPGSGFLWDRAIAAGISFRNYGEWNVENDPKTDRNYLAGLKDHFDPRYLDAIGDVTDQARMDEFEREFREFEKTGTLPRLVLMHLPNDHTVGAKPGYPTPTAMVGDNDLALGRLVDIVSHSRYWRQSVIFVLEDDAQDGPDHVDARRSPLLVISPYTRRGASAHAEYSTVSVLKTIEQILGLPSMTYFDDRAPSLLAEFATVAKPEPFRHRQPAVDLNQRTQAGAPGAKESDAWDFSRPDRVPSDALNRVIWQSVKGGVLPPPVHTQVALCCKSSNGGPRD
jgi:DNA-binding beta-propeller fold protein YncE